MCTSVPTSVPLWVRLLNKVTQMTVTENAQSSTEFLKEIFLQKFNSFFYLFPSGDSMPYHPRYPESFASFIIFAVSSSVG